MKTTNTKILIATFMAALLGFSSCKKEENTVTKEMSYAAKVEAFSKTTKKQAAANMFYVNMVTNSLQGLLNGVSGGVSGKKAEWICATITNDTTVNPHVVTLDFGTTGCTDPQNGYFSGKVTIEYNNSDMGANGCHLFATFDNFVRDSISVNGTAEYFNNGTNGAGNMVGTVSLSGQTGYIHDRIQLSGTTNIGFEWVNARETAYLTINGSGTDNNGFAYNQSTTTTITQNKTAGCSDHFVSGVLLLQTAGLPDETIDYGNGTCDDQATSTINGVTTTFTLQ